MMLESHESACEKSPDGLKALDKTIDAKLCDSSIASWSENEEVFGVRVLNRVHQL